MIITGQEDIGKFFLRTKVTQSSSQLTSNPKALESSILNNVYKASRNQIQALVTNIVRKSLRDHPTFQRIGSGALNADFGFEPGTSQGRVEGIVQSIITENTSLDLYINENIIRVSYIVNTEALFDLEEARVKNDSKNSSSGRHADSLEWLQWILLYGQKAIVRDYRIELGGFPNPPSRSQEAIMVKDYGNFWSVPGDVAGTPGDNWITQSLDTSEPLIRNIIKKTLLETMAELYG